MRLLLLIALGGLTARLASAQAPAPPLASQWGWGIRAGIGQGSGQYRNGSGQDNITHPIEGLFGLLATRYFARPRASLNLEALAGVQPVYVSFLQGNVYPNYQPQTLHQWRLFLPLYLRTGTPASRLHLLAGAGPTFRPGLTSDAAYYSHPVELTFLLGAEARLTPFRRYETTLGLRVHVPFTSAYAYGYPTFYTSQGIYVSTTAWQEVNTPWVGLTLGTTLYPASARP